MNEYAIDKSCGKSISLFREGGLAGNGGGLSYAVLMDDGLVGCREVCPDVSGAVGHIIFQWAFPPAKVPVAQLADLKS